MVGRPHTNRLNGSRTRALVITLSLLVLVFSLIGCATKEEKRDQFLQQGIRLYEAGQYKKAILEFKNALQLDPDCALGYLYVGRAYFKEGNIKKAKGNISKAVTLDEALDDARLDLGMILVVTKEGEEALETIGPILDKDPTHVRALLIAAQAYLALRSPDSALENLGKIDPAKRDKEVLFTFAGAYNLKGETEKVKQYLSEYQKTAPDDPISYQILSTVYAKKGELKKAEAELRKLIEQKEGDTSYPLLLCKFFLDTGQEKKAEAEFERLVTENPGENAYKPAYAEFLFNNKRFDESQALMTEAVRNDPDSWKLRDHLVKVYLSQGKVDSALKELDDFVHRNVKKGKIEALVKKGQVMARLGRWEDAAHQCDLALAIETTNPDAHLLKGKVLLEKGNFEDAILHLRQAVDIKPSEPEGYIFLAKAVALSGDISLSIEELKQGLKNVPQNSALLMELIRYYQREHEWEYALEAANAGMAQHPRELAYEIQKGRMLVRLKKLDKAEKVFTSVIERYPSIVAGYVELGRLKKATGKYGEATALFEKALDTEEKSAVALTLLLETYMETKQETRAEALCKTMLKDSPENALLLTTLGSIYLQQGKYQEAEHHFKAAIEVSPRWRRPHYGLVAVYTQTDRLQETSHDLGKKYTQNPGSLGIGFTLSLLYEELGQYDKAIALWEELVTKYSDTVTINNNLAYLYAEHFPDPERLNKALKYARKALNRAPDNPQVLDTVAWVEFKRGNVDKAIKYTDSAVKGAENEPVIQYHAGLINAKIGKNKAAKGYLSKAMELGLKEEYAKECERVLETLK